MSPGETIAELIRAKHGSFTHPEVVALTGVEDETLQNWAKRKIINPVVSAPGRQGRREYSGFDLASICVGLKLVDLGLPPAQALPLGNRCIVDLTMSRVHFSESENGEWTINDDVADLVQVLVGKLSADGLLRVQLLPRLELANLDAGLDPYIVLPFGQLVLDIAQRAAALRA